MLQVTTSLCAKVLVFNESSYALISQPVNTLYSTSIFLLLITITGAGSHHILGKSLFSESVLAFTWCSRQSQQFYITSQDLNDLKELFGVHTAYLSEMPNASSSTGCTNWDKTKIIMSSYSWTNMLLSSNKSCVVIMQKGRFHLFSVFALSVLILKLQDHLQLQ